MNKILCVMMLFGIFAISFANVSADYAPGTPDFVLEPKIEQRPVSDVGWFTKAAHPTTRAHCMVSPVVNGKYYVFGGPTVSGGAYTNVCYEYNTNTDAWTLKTPMPTARGIGRAVLVQGKIYVIGGAVTFGTGLNVVEIYDPVTDAWTTGPSLPVGNHDFGAGVYKDTWVYVCGGGNWSAPPIATVYVLNTVTNTWATATAMPTAMGTPGCGVIGNKIVMATGYVGSAGSNIVQVGTISPTDPTSITWTTGAAMPGGVIYRGNSGVCNGQLYVCGGNLASGISNAANKYDPATNSWTALPNKPTAVSNVYGMAADPAGKLYYPVGYNGSAYLTVHEMLDDASYANDVGVDAIHAPGSAHLAGNPITPMARIKNYGSAAQTNFQVVCSIIGTSGAVHVNTQTVSSLASGDTTRLTFGTWTSPTSGSYTTKIRTLLTGDQNPGNDMMSVVTNVGAWLLREGFNDVAFPPAGWDTIRVTGTSANNIWSRVTAGTNPTCTPVEGAGMARYYSYLATAGNKCRLVSPVINLGTTPRGCSLKFYMTHDPGYATANETLAVQYTLDGTTYIDVATFTRYAATFAWTEHPVYLGSLSGNIRFAFLATSQFGDNIFIDDVRLESGSVGIAEEMTTPVFTTLNEVKPNPLRGNANISFNIAKPSMTNLKIYDASGRVIKTLLSSNLASGAYNLTWNGRDDNDRAVAEGIYFYTLETESNHITKKLVLTR